jgi:U3 small nucleolar RNA-associated protein 18
LSFALFAGDATSVLKRGEEDDDGDLDFLRDGAAEDTSAARSSEAAWFDSDDEEERGEGTRVKEAKKRVRTDRFAARHATWAKVRKGDDTTTGSEHQRVFSSTAPLTANRAFVLERNEVKIKRVANVNAEARSSCLVSSLEFSATSKVALTAGLDRTLRLFQVAEKKCSKLHSIYFPDLPIKRAFFIPQTDEILCLGPRKLFHVYDMRADAFSRVPHLLGQVEQSWAGCVPSPDGQYAAFLGGESGNVVLFSTRTRQIADTFKTGAPADWAQFAPDGTHLWISGRECGVFKWDVRMTRRCLARFRDVGSIEVTALSASPDGRWLAVGDRSGMCNVYDLRLEGDGKQMMPHKTLSQLRTSITGAVWSHDSQILGTYSSALSSAARLVHVPSFTAFGNWPAAVQLNLVGSMAISPNSGYLAVGNNTGDALMFRLLSYTAY